MIIDAIKQHAPNDIAVISGQELVSYSGLIARSTQVAQWLVKHNVQSLVLMDDNSVDWLVLDLACQLANVCITPLPTFFSETQVAHVIALVSPDLLVTAENLALEAIIDNPFSQLNCYLLKSVKQAIMPKGTAKITFTSGSTGAPKGVCLSLENQFNVAQSLMKVIDLKAPRHLALLPFSLLLENIAGLYAPLLAGGTVVIANEAQRGFSGYKLANVPQLLSCISESQPNTMIIVPELLGVLLHAAQQGWQPPASFKFLAVGGSKTASAMIAIAHQVGLPVYQGYGLSECSSVVSLQTQYQDDFDSVGKVLPHLTVTTEDGELVVHGNSFLGYINEPDSWGHTSVATGDLVEISNDKLFIAGRKKNLLVNSYGRNISPEWLESELQATGLFAQCLVFGDGKPFCGALLYPISDAITDQQIENAISQINAYLPDYACIEKYHRLTEAMTAEQGLLTSNGRPKRDAILSAFEPIIADLYLSAASGFIGA